MFVQPNKKSFLISSEPNQDKVVALPKKNKIHKEIFEKVKVQDTNRDLFKRQKQVWDNKQKRFKKIFVDEKNEKMSGQSLRMDTSSVTKKFNSWKKQTGVKILADGQKINKNQQESLKNSFLKRKQQNFKPRKETQISGWF